MSFAEPARVNSTPNAFHSFQRPGHPTPRDPKKHSGAFWRIIAYSVAALLLISIAIWLGALVVKKPARFFRHVDIDGWYRIVGRYPLSEKEATKVSHYEFSYDNKRQLIAVWYFVNGRLSSDPYFGVAQIIISYSDDFMEYRYFDYEDKPKSSGGVFSNRLRLNKDGNPTSLFNYDEYEKLSFDSNRVAQYLWTLDSKGRRIQSRRLNQSGEPISDKYGASSLDLQYDKYGNETNSTFYDPEGKTIYSQARKCDKNGNCVEIACFGTNGQRLALGGWAIERTQYNENGYATEDRFYGTDERLSGCGDGVAVVRYNYDEMGNRIEQVHLNVEGQPEDDSEGVARYAWKYGGTTDVETVRYNVKGQVVKSLLEQAQDDLLD